MLEGESEYLYQVGLGEGLEQDHHDQRVYKANLASVVGSVSPALEC